MATSLEMLLGRSAKRVLKQLQKSVVTHDSIDDMALGNYLEDSPRFQKMMREDPPLVPTGVEEPEPIDMTVATSDEIVAYQKAARESAPPYNAWPELGDDVFRSFHTHDQPELLDATAVDPSVALHTRIMPKLMSTDEHAESRNITRDDPAMSAIATMATVRELRKVLDEELHEQVKEAQEFQERREEAQTQQEGLEGMREEARQLHSEGKPVPEKLKEEIKAAVEQQRQALSQATQLAENPTPMNAQAAEAIANAATSGQEAAEAAKGMPSFGSGLGAGEPTYTSPEQALSIAEQWANNPDLKAMAELFGRMDREIRFKRSKRVVGGQDEIVDVKFGDNLNRVLPSELALLSDPDFEDDFFARYASQELLEFSTVGEENAGRGPIVMVIDGSYSMAGERNIWARAVAMCLLHIARIEMRDFALVEFASAGQVTNWQVPARKALDGQQVIDMASHMFGGGTSPILGVAEATKLMKDAPEFRKADIVMVGDGEAPFGAEDEALRRQNVEMGVRLFGIAVGGEMTGQQTYLHRYCEHVVDVHDFNLTDPSAATAELATHVT